jgi:hypothetical protein
MTAADGYAVPLALRSARYVPRQAPGRREPLRVTASAFRARGLEVPEDHTRWNVYQLSERQGFPWSQQVDYHVHRRGAELLGRSEFLCIDLDQHLAVDGSVWLDGLRWLADTGIATGNLLDITTFVTVRTPGNPDRGHGRGWHLWCRADLDYPVRTGPLARCAAVEIKLRCTAPGSPGYEVRHAPSELPAIPRWIAELAGRPRPLAVVHGGTGRVGAWGRRRLETAISRLLEAGRGHRNHRLYLAALSAGEIGADYDASVTTLMDVVARIGLIADDGDARCLATIRSGYDAGAANRRAAARG